MRASNNLESQAVLAARVPRKTAAPFIKRRKKGLRGKMRRVKKLFRGGVATVVCRHNAVTALHSDVNIKTNEATHGGMHAVPAFCPIRAMCLYIGQYPGSIARETHPAGNLLSREREICEGDATDKISQAAKFY